MLLDVLRTAYRWYALNKAPFELLGLGLAVLGTLFAMLSIKDGQKLTRELRTVFDHLTTREIGAFPAYMHEVEQLFGAARVLEGGYGVDPDLTYLVDQRELKLLNLTQKVQDVLQVTKLYTVFDVKEDEFTAVKSFDYFFAK